MEYANIIQSTDIGRAKFYNQFEKELKGIINCVSLFFKIIGSENKIENGPNLIIANHPGIGKEIAALIKMYSRALYFTLRKELTNVKEFKDLAYSYLKKYIPLRKELTNVKEFKVLAYSNFKKYNPIIRKILEPLVSYLISYIPDRLNKLGMIPFDITSKDSEVREEYNQNSLDKTVELLEHNQAVVMLQYNQKGRRSKYHHYIPSFSPSIGMVALELYKKNFDIPITLIVFKGGQGFFPDPLNPTVAYVNKPIYFKDYVAENKLEGKILSGGYDKRTSLHFARFLEKWFAGIFINKLGLPNNLDYYDINNVKKPA